jgi:hypothetical protein
MKWKATKTLRQMNIASVVSAMVAMRLSAACRGKKVFLTDKIGFLSNLHSRHIGVGQES